MSTQLSLAIALAIPSDACNDARFPWNKESWLTCFGLKKSKRDWEATPQTSNKSKTVASDGTRPNYVLSLGHVSSLDARSYEGTSGDEIPPCLTKSFTCWQSHSDRYSHVFHSRTSPFLETRTSLHLPPFHGLPAPDSFWHLHRWSRFLKQPKSPRRLRSKSVLGERSGAGLFGRWVEFPNPDYKPTIGVIAPVTKSHWSSNYGKLEAGCAFLLPKATVPFGFTSWFIFAAGRWMSILQ